MWEPARHMSGICCAHPSVGLLLPTATAICQNRNFSIESFFFFFIPRQECRSPAEFDIFSFRQFEGQESYIVGCLLPAAQQLEIVEVGETHFLAYTGVLVMGEDRDMQCFLVYQAVPK